MRAVCTVVVAVSEPPGPAHQAQHRAAVLRQLGDGEAEKLREARPNIPPERPRVLAAEPYLRDALADGAADARDDGLGSVAAELAAGVLRLAVGARAQAA